MQSYGENNEVRQRRRRDTSPFEKGERSPMPAARKSYFETLEYIAFIVIGSAAWILIAWKVLAWQKFPFHLYVVEVGFIFAIPIILLVIILSLTDRITRL